MTLHNVIAAFTPFPILETKRLILRKLQPDDAPEVLALFSDDDVLRYHDLSPLHSLVEATNLIRRLTRRYQDFSGLRWAITLRNSDDRLIGTGGLNRITTHNMLGMIGYDLIPAYWGQGYATEAVRAVVQFGFENVGLNRLEAQTMLWNVASMRVLHKVGFTEEGILREWGYWKGAYHDLRMYSLLRREYEQQILSSNQGD